MPMCCVLAKDPSAVRGCGGGSSAASRRPVERQRCGVLRRPTHLRPGLVLRPLRVRARDRWDVWRLRKTVLQRLPREDPQSPRVRKEASALPAVPLPEPLESLRYRVQGLVPAHHEGAFKVETELSDYIYIYIYRTLF